MVNYVSLTSISSHWCVEFIVDILVVFPFPVTTVLLMAKTSSLVSSGISSHGVLLFSSRATFRFTLHNKQPYELCNHLKTDISPGSTGFFLKMEACEDLFTRPSFYTNRNDLGLGFVSNFR